MKKLKGTIDEAFPLYQKRFHTLCPHCGVRMDPSLMAIANHWPVCIKGKAIKILAIAPLIDEIERIVKIK